MNFRFFGDSWYWNWIDNIQSNALKKLAKKHSRLPDHFSNNISGIEIFLNDMGHEVEVFNYPGKNFTETVELIEKTPVSIECDFNVVFFSEIFREAKLFGSRVKNYEKTMDRYNNHIIDALVKLNEWAINNKQRVLLFGGQGTLPRKLFETALPKKTGFVFLCSECILSDIANNYLDQPRNLRLGTFKFSNWVNQINHRWNRQLVDEIHQDLEFAFNFRTQEGKIFMWPDYFHLNITGHLYFVDMLFNFIEKKFPDVV